MVLLDMCKGVVKITLVMAHDLLRFPFALAKVGRERWFPLGDEYDYIKDFIHGRVDDEHTSGT